MDLWRSIGAATFVGFLVALVIQYADWPAWRGSDSDLRSYLLLGPKGFLCVLLACLGATTYFVALFGLGPSSLAKLRPSRGIATWRDTLGLVAAVLLFAGPPVLIAIAYRRNVLGYVNHYPKVLVFTAIAVYVYLLIAEQMLQIRHELAKIGEQPAHRSEDLQRFVELRDELGRLLLLLGLMVSLGALGAGALRNAWNAALRDHPELFSGMEPKPEEMRVEGILTFCACNSLPVLIAYAPAYGALVRTGRRLVNSCLAANDPAAAACRQAARERAELEKTLQIDSGMAERLKSAIIILSPILTGALSFLLPVK
jgi:hypothetical protein